MQLAVPSLGTGLQDEPDGGVVRFIVAGLVWRIRAPSGPERGIYPAGTREFRPSCEDRTWYQFARSCGINSALLS